MILSNIIISTWCPPYNGEKPDLETLYKENKNSDIAVLAVNLTTSEQTTKQNY
jgi:thiol-disulfide isomerase/thioredoxin